MLLSIEQTLTHLWQRRFPAHITVGGLRLYNRAFCLKAAGSFLCMIFLIPDRHILAVLVFTQKNKEDYRMIIRTATLAPILVIAMATIPEPAQSSLRSLSQLSPGDYCNTDCQTTSCHIMEKTDTTVPASEMQDHPTCTNENTADISDGGDFGDCWLNKTPGNYVICTRTIENACNLLHDGNDIDYTSWKTYNNTNHSVSRYEITSTSSNYYYCKTTTVTKYGCAANYYATSGSDTSSIKCTACPSSKTGGLGDGVSQGASPVGSTSIIDCYIPKDEEICDASGCFDLMDKCYYKN